MADVSEVLHEALQAINVATAKIQHAYQLIYEMGGAGAPGHKLLAVPWMSQLGPDAAYSNSDCGPACVAMLLRSLGKSPTVDQVSASTGLPRGYKYTKPANLIAAAAAYGVNLERRLNMTIEALRESIERGKPVIVLVHYPSLPDKVRFDPKFNAGHWVLVVGVVDDGGVLYHDPYWPDTRGQAVRVSRADFERVMWDCSLDGNTPDQALVLEQ